MRYRLLAVDFDGTLADHGHVPETTIETLRQLRESGRKLVMVSGRRLEPLLELCPWISLFDLVVAENGALLYWPETGEEKPLAPAPPAELAERLDAAGVDRIAQGRVVVATWQPHETACLAVIQEMALDLQIIFNKGAVMLLPSGCNKATGLQTALEELEISPINMVAAGDAENDSPMLRMAGVSVAVDNALPAVKEICDLVMPSPRGAGVNEVCQMILEDDLASLRLREDRGVSLGERLDGRPFQIPAYGDSVLVTGGPAGGKSRFAMRFIEELRNQRAQCCIVDPEGDYRDIENSVTIGTVERAPAIEEVVQLLQKPSGNAVVSFFAVEKKDRPEYFNKLFRALAELRSRTARPHWIIVDEAHYMAPKGWVPAESWNQDELKSIMFITAYHEKLSDAVLESADWIVSIADEPAEPIAECARRMGHAEPETAAPADRNEPLALAWRRGEITTTWFRRLLPESEGKRHRHTLMNGEIDAPHQFIFRGAGNEFNLKAKNLSAFINLAEGLDDGTWMFHLRNGDYSRWFQEVIKDPELAETARQLEQGTAASAQDSRKMIFEKIRANFEPSASERS